MLLSTKSGQEMGCHVLGMGSSATGPGPAPSALESCQSDALAET